MSLNLSFLYYTLFLWFQSFFFFWGWGHTLSMQKIMGQGQGLNPHHSCNPSHCSYNAGSLSH